MHCRTSEQEQPSQQEVREETTSQPQLRRSSRQRKPNPRYANAALAEEDQVRELLTYEEASQSVDWQRAMEDEIQALKENQT